MDDRRDQLDALLVSLRERVDAFILAIEQADALQPVERALRRILLRESSQLPEVVDVRSTGISRYNPRSSGRYDVFIGGSVDDVAPSSATTIRPSSGRITPTSIRTVVVLPAPLGPRREKTQREDVEREIVHCPSTGKRFHDAGDVDQWLHVSA